MTTYEGTMYLAVKWPVQVDARSRAEAGRVLKATMGDLLDEKARDTEEIVGLRFWGTGEAPDVFWKDAPLVVGWHLEGKSPLPRAFDNGPSPRRVADLLEEL